MDAISSARTSTPTPAAAGPAPAPQATAPAEMPPPQDEVSISPAAMQYLRQEPALPHLPRMSDTQPSPQQGGGNVLGSLAGSLPGYVGDCVKAKGISLPGTTASLAPRFDNGGFTGGPSGANFTLKF